MREGQFGDVAGRYGAAPIHLLLRVIGEASIPNLQSLPDLVRTSTLPSLCLCTSRPPLEPLEVQLDPVVGPVSPIRCGRGGEESMDSPKS